MYIDILAVFAFASATLARPEVPECSLLARTETGWVCGAHRLADNGNTYASFRGVPYAKQPLGELRFKELQPAESWEGLYDATLEGPVCPQLDVLYGRIMQPRGMSEACIHANIHVPLENLPEYKIHATSGIDVPHHAGFDSGEDDRNGGLPVVVFIHGGGFAFGSGDSDLNGPEYIVSKRAILITFNYRLNVFGFLSLNSTSIPGNNGLRDMVTLLKWVQRNVKYFGGNPNEVTLVGQSAGAASAHLLSLSDVTEGLFKRIWIMSGTATANFYTSSPIYAKFLATTLMSVLGINSSDPEEVHRKLIATPIKQIMEANAYMINLIGLTTFVPVVESPLPGVERMLVDDPSALIAKGCGKNIPTVVGFTNSECEVFRHRFQEVDVISQINADPSLVVPLQLIYTMPKDAVLKASNAIIAKYFNGTVDMDGMVKLCSDSNFIYPAMKLATTRAAVDGAPVYLYQFSYDNEHSVIKEGMGISFKGAGHIEDLTYILYSNSILGSNHYSSKYYQAAMKDWMTMLFMDFVYSSQPAGEYGSVSMMWPALKKGELKYEDICTPRIYSYKNATDYQHDMKRFFDSLAEKSS